MAMLLASLLALFAAVARAQYGSIDDYMWSEGLDKESAAQLKGPLFASPDFCSAGSSGIRGLNLTECINVCSLSNKCQVVAWYPSWFKGSSACFAYSDLSENTQNSATSTTPVALDDQDVRVGVKKSVLDIGKWDSKFKWTKGAGVGSPAQQKDPIFLSTDACKAGNGGLGGLELEECLELCITFPNCKAVAYYETWFNGDSACFAYSSASSALVKTAIYTEPTKLTAVDAGNYLAVRVQSG